MRIIFGPKRDEVPGEWKRLQNVEVTICTSYQTLFGLSNREECDGGQVARMGERRGVSRVLVGETEGKRTRGSPRRRWEDNMRWIFRKWFLGHGLG